MLKRLGWYPLSPVGRTLAAIYAVIPAYLVCSLYLEVFPPTLTLPVVGGMSVITVCAVAAKRRNVQLFRAKPARDGGFTLIELLVVISIIGILATMLMPLYVNARKAAYTARAKAELRNIAVALERYAIDNGGYPPDVSRNLPPGLEKYLAPGTWPAAPWPGSVYDWDNWAASDMAYPPNTQTYQISIRFCTDINTCSFPNETWAAGFDYYSAVYYCVSGSCRAHSSQPTDHAGYCINC